ncbi:MAG TPA: peptidase T [Firmicutes bacterium]|nr:peptidase T [Bacillota bacterium]
MRVEERLLHYVSFGTNSDPASETCPSTPNQLVLAKALVEEMKGLGISDAHVDEHGYVYGTIPATPGREKEPAIGFIAHMDTSSAAKGDGIQAKIVKDYDGGDILLNEEKQIYLKPSEYESLKQYAGQDLIVTDGTTLLGADDKAGIAEILTMAEKLPGSGKPHGKICIGFTPDEEIGRGANRFDVQKFGADFAYTVDGGELGEVECDNFNAASAKVVIHGLSIHPGSAKGKMKNSLLIGMEFQGMLPAFENPAFTEGHEGFSHLGFMQGTEEQTVMEYIIRDHNREKFEKMKERFVKTADFLNEKYGKGTVETEIQDSYYNMMEIVNEHPEILERAKHAMEAVGAKVLMNPIRGGTDGARLSYMGLPCPNLSTGGHNFHGRFEYIPVQSMEKMVEVLLQIASC